MTQTNATPGVVYAAALTPLHADLSPDHAALARHCRWLLDNGCDGLAVLGTTGEANSFSGAERMAIVEGLIKAGIPAASLMPGVGCCAVPDTVALTRHALAAGVTDVLMLPPFYYKGVDDDGLFAAFAEVIEQTGDDALRIYLYHFPQISQVPLSLNLIERLLARYPGTIAGMKDSSGNLDNMVQAARAFPGFRVLSGSDSLLLPLLEAGGAGCITAVANVACHMARKICDDFTKGDATTAHAELDAVRTAIARFPLSAALKEILARHTGDEDWRALRPPLARLGADHVTDLMAGLDATGAVLPPSP